MMGDFIQCLRILFFRRVIAKASGVVLSARWVLVLVCMVTAGYAQKTLVRDINVKKITGEGSNPAEFAEMNGVLYFKAKSPFSGYELWKTDNTVSGTAMVKDINPGTQSAFTDAENFVVMNNTLYFIANDGVHGVALWKSDGTESGTVMVIDPMPQGGTFPWKPLTVVGDQLFFAVNAAGTGQALWKSDGTTAGSVAVTPGGKVSVENLINFKGTLFFEGNDGVHGSELWKSDGTDAGTVIVKDINPGDHLNHSEPHGFVVFEDALYFSASVGMDFELWKTDGTTAGTVRVKDFNPVGASYPSGFTPYKSMLYFSARDEHNVQWLLKTDGTDAGTVKVKELWNVSSISVAGDALYFSASDGVHGAELWKSDGTEAGTVMVKDLDAAGSGSPGSLRYLNDFIYFTAVTSADGRELWKTDGTEAGTVMVKDIRPGTGYGDPSQLVTFRDALLFVANDGTNDRELWKSDGSEAGTTMLKKIFDKGDSSFPDDLTRVGQTVYFTATDGVHGYELWKTDGTAANTSMLKDIEPGAGHSEPAYLTEVNGSLYFSTEKTLWKSNGTENGTLPVRQFSTGDPTNLVNVNGMLFFTAIDAASGRELWRSDGTAEGTELVKDVNPGTTGSAPANLTNVNGILYFTTRTSTTSYELWKSNGTEGGTVKVKVLTVAQSANPRVFRNVNGVLCFLLDDGVHGYELWKSDGTESGTVMVKDIFPGADQSAISGCSVANGTLYFSANDGVHGNELWKSDGTESGTVMVKDIIPGAESGDPYGYTYLNGFVHFAARQDATGSELWKTDGTDAGTVMVKDIVPGAQGSDLSGMLVAANTLYFCIANSDGKYEIFRTNGTACSTVASTNDPFIKLEGPGLVELNGKLLFAATSGETGTELFMYNTALDKGECPQTITFGPLADKVYGTAPFAPQGTSSSGLPVMFSSDNPEVASIVDNVLTIHKTGTVRIQANQAGDKFYEAAQPVSQVLQIVKADQTITFAALPQRAIGEAPFGLSATASSSLSVTFKSSNAAVATVAGNTLTITGVGETIITAHQDGDHNFNAASPVSQVLLIVKADQTITFAELPSRIFGEGPFGLSATASSSLGVTFGSSNAAVATVTGDLLTITGPGETIITAYQDGDNHFNAAPPVQRTLSVQLVTGVETSRDALVHAYPNPVSDVLHVSGIFSEFRHAEVLDALGRVVARQTAAPAGGNEIALDVAHLKPAIYHVRIHTSKHVFSQQIIKK